MRRLRHAVAILVAVILLAATGQAGASSPHGGSASTSTRVGRAQLIVQFRPGVSEAARGIAHREVKARPRGRLSGVHADVVDVDNTEKALAGYRARRDVESVEINGRVHMLAAPVDNEYAKQWNLQPVSAADPASLDWEPVYPTNTGAGVVVAVVDTGFHHGGADEPLHIEDALAYNFVNNSPDATDDNGHGTHVTGTIAQRTGNRPTATDTPSVAGIASDARIIPVKVLDAQGGGTAANTIAGLLWAVNKGAKVINLSLGGTYSKALCDAVTQASRSALVIAASGNEANGGLTPVDYPAACPGAIAVGGLRADGSRGPYSNGGCENGLVAPGGDLDPRTEVAPYGDPRNGILQEQWVPPTPTAPGRFGFFFDSGTSMSAAHVAAPRRLAGHQPRHHDCRSRVADDGQRSRTARAR